MREVGERTEAMAAAAVASTAACAATAALVEAKGALAGQATKVGHEAAAAEGAWSAVHWAAAQAVSAAAAAAEDMPSGQGSISR